jgi:hypothetical protein
MPYCGASNLFSTCVPPWQPISINCTLHVSKIFVINIVAVISNLYVDVCELFRHYSIFFAYLYMSWFVLLGVRVPQVENHCLKRCEEYYCAIRKIIWLNSHPLKNGCMKLYSFVQNVIFLCAEDLRKRSKRNFENIYKTIK